MPYNLQGRRVTCIRCKGREYKADLNKVAFPARFLKIEDLQKLCKFQLEERGREMEALKNFSKTNHKNKWRKRFTQNQSPKNPLPTQIIFFLLFIFFFSFLLFVSSKHLLLQSLFSVPKNFLRDDFLRQCKSAKNAPEKFMWYAPHSGFSNQLAEFKNAILMAAILNRTLVVLPILDHHAVALGSCPKFRVLSPNDLRLAVWNHSIDLFRNRRYVSIADIIDLSSVVSDSAVRFIDFRVFVSHWCGLSIGDICSKANTVHRRVTRITGPSSELALFEELNQCGMLLSGYRGSVNDCLYALDEDCRTTVWTFQNDGEDGILDSFQPDEQLKQKKKISFVRRRRDVYKAVGPGSMAGSAAVLAFGSLFTTPYKGSESHIDIHKVQKDKRIQSVIQKIDYLPFVPEIIEAGKEFALRKIKAPFLCAQLRLLDGQFKNHWKATFLGLKQKLESLRPNGPLPIHIFVMTDLPMSNWTGSYLGDLAKDSDAFKLFVLRENNDLVVETAKKIMNIAREKSTSYYVPATSKIVKNCNHQALPDILLYLEETICSCASLGFVGTAGSTIAESIELMRKHSTCSG